MSIQKVVDRLDFCKSAGANKWMARCPAHDDRGPSLSLTEKPHKVTGELTPLIYCHAGCSSEDVLAAVGLGWEDVLPEKLEHNPAQRTRTPQKSLDEWKVEIVMADLAAGKKLSEQDKSEARAAMQRLDNNQRGPDVDPRQVERNSLEVGKREAERMAIIRDDFMNKQGAA